MIKTLIMYQYQCDACVCSEAPPQHGNWLPYEWEEETINGKVIHFCPFHKYGLDKHERERVRVASES